MLWEILRGVDAKKQDCFLEQFMRERESIEQLKKYPVFRQWRAKAEAHELEFRPLESARLKAAGTFDNVIDERTECFWNMLVDATAAGAAEDAAEEIAVPVILLPDEDDEQDDLEGDDFNSNDPSDDWTPGDNPITTLVTLANGRLLSLYEFHCGLRDWRTAAFASEPGEVLDGPFIYKSEVLRPVAHRRGGIVVQMWDKVSRQWVKGKPGSLQNAMRGKLATPDELQQFGL